VAREHCVAMVVIGVGNFFTYCFLSKQGRTNMWEENKIVGFFCKKKSVVKFSIATSIQQVGPSDQNMVVVVMCPT
jgi:hypothetical protein